ncbi:nSTAND1 domain-containing NTPase [Dankookia rubra]|nr:TIR domain-containing protein [Dankookia rubra]
MAVPDAGSAPQLFLSHAGADTEAARRLKQRLEAAPDALAAGLRVWLDVDDLRPGGVPWQEQIEEVIEERATAFAVYIGSRGVSAFVWPEVRLALSRAVKGDGRFPFVPMIAAGVDSTSLPGFVRQFQAVRDPENNPEEFRKLLAAALGRGDEAGGLKAEAEPFFGLRAIGEERSHLFFGRERETEDLLRCLRERRLLLVAGDSGSGKSSLVKAGLVPRWRAGALAELDDRWRGENLWQVVEMRLGQKRLGQKQPGQNPRLALGKAVEAAARRLGVSFNDRNKMAEAAEQGTIGSVRRALRCGLDPQRTRTLVVVDQLEELVTSTPKEQRKSFVELLFGLADPADEAFSVVLTMRRDYYNLLSAPECRTLYDRLEADERAALYPLGRMTDEGLRRIVTEPLRMAGVGRGEREALADAVLRDVGARPGDLALVQFALTRAWERRAEFGGDLLRAYGGVGRVDGALALEAERVFEQELGGEAQEAEVTAALIRLARLEGTAGPTRRVARRREFPDERWGLLQKLATEAGNRLALIGGDQADEVDGAVNGRETAEIAHEALLTRWPRLRRWLVDAQDDKRTLDRLADQAAEWADAPAPEAKDKLLAKTDAEREAFQSLARVRRSWLSAEERAFVAASVKDHRKRLKDNEERLKRERQAAFDLAEAERRRAQEQVEAAWKQAEAAKKARGLRNLATAAAAFFFLAAVSAVALWADARAAKRETFANVSRALAALSETASLHGRYTDALKLAVASWPRTVADPRPMLERSLHAMGLATEGRMEADPPLRHEAPVLSAAFSPDGKKVLTVSSDGAAQLWSTATGELLGPPLRHEVPVLSAAFSSDGTKVFTVSGDGAAQLWNAATGEPLGPPLRHEVPVLYVALSQDGARLLIISDDRTARLWDLRGESPSATSLQGYLGPVRIAALSHNGPPRVLAISIEGVAQLWDAITGAPVGEPMRHVGSVVSAAFSADGAWIVTASEDRTARLWNAATGEPLGPPLRHEGPVVSAAFSADGARIVTASEDRTARLWNAATGEPLGPPLRHEGPVVSAAFSADGARVATTSQDRNVRLWDAFTGYQLGPPLQHEGAVLSAAFSHDGTRVLTVSDGRAVHLWDAAGGEPIGPPLLHEGAVLSAAFNRDGTKVVTVPAVGTAQVWNVATSKPLGRGMRHGDVVTVAALSPDGALVATASGSPFFGRGGTARVWDASTGEPLGREMRHEGPVQSIAFSPLDGSRLVTASTDGTARLWRAHDATPIGRPMRHEGPVLAAAFSPDGALVVTASSNPYSNRGGTARVWDAATGEPLGREMNHESLVLSAAVRRDGPDRVLVITASADRTARVWDAAHGEPLGPPLQHKDAVTAAAFSPDGTKVLTASSDRTARLWDAITGAPVGEPMRHEGSVQFAAFSPDGTRVLTTSSNPYSNRGGTARVWDAATGAPIGRGLRHRDALSAAAFSPDKTRVITASVDGTARLWASNWPLGPITAVACALLDGKGVERLDDLAERHGIVVSDAICGPDMPAPDPTRLDRR